MTSKRDVASTLGKEYEMRNTGCAQSTIAAIFDSLGIWSESVFRAGTGLADGLGLTGDGSCGALVGASMVISYLFPRERENFGDMFRAMKAYRLVKELHDEYVREFGSCRCQDVQKKLMGRSFNLWDPKEFNEAVNSNMMEYCSNVVAWTAGKAVEIIELHREK
ncbi:C-GCAxxG-C-C family protein [Archaeoglobus neptunius]|uniref:C-GCAxxG-C-C family protein n=1 Tax=Archaeoglobus neptunius TaxID=2798580 RepID=UPI0019276532|nr:C-GCAxxG-C-C family protein [Archaeoglobus neptunius]